MARRRALLAILAAFALLVPVSSAGAGPAANRSGEELVSYLETGKLEANRTITFDLLCGAPAGQACQITVRTKLTIKGIGSVGPLESSLPFAGGQGGTYTLKVSKRDKGIIRQNVKRSRLITEVTATNLTTGEIDVDEQTFRLKK
jgi:hypothetical protein